MTLSEQLPPDASRPSDPPAESPPAGPPPAGAVPPSIPAEPSPAGDGEPTTPGADEAPPAEPPPAGPPPRPGRPPGIREQVARTIAAGRRLADAQIALAKAELAVILEDAKKVAALVGMALALLLYVGLLVSVGMPLFLGEWIFGSMGWGILHGTLFSIATAVILVLIALRISRTYLAGTLLVSMLVGLAVGVVLGLALPNAAYAAIAETAAPGTETGIGPLAVGLALWGAVFALLGLLLGARASGAGGALGGFLAGAILGALFGAFTAISFSPQVGAALGVTVTLVTWPVLASLRLRDYDWEALKQHFTPQASIDAAMETKAFVEARLPGKKEDAA